MSKVKGIHTLEEAEAVWNASIGRTSDPERAAEIVNYVSDAILLLWMSVECNPSKAKTEP